MNQPRDANAPVQPVTTRIGGGSSARVGALVAVGILGAVIYAALSGRTPPPPEAALPATDPPGPTAPAAAASTHSPTAEASPRSTVQPTSRPTRAPTAPPEPHLAGITFGEDAFAVIAFIESRMYLDVLHEGEPGHYRGSFRLPFPESGPAGHTIELAQLWTRDRRRPAYVQLGSWPLQLEPLLPGTGLSGPVLYEQVEPRPRLRGVPRPARRGFSISVRAESHDDHGVVLVEVTLGPGRQLIGGDGIFGWPTTVGLESSPPIQPTR